MSINALLAITPWPAMSAIIWVVVLVAVLYLARHTAHQAIRTASGAISRGLRVASHSVQHAQSRLALRNREVLLAAGRDPADQLIAATAKVHGLTLATADRAVRGARIVPVI